MSFSKFVVVGTAAASLLLGTIAFAAEFNYGEHSWTAISGHSGTVAELTAPSGYGISAMHFYEKIDDPVLISADGHRLSSEIGEYSYLGDIHIRLGYGSSEYLEVGLDQFITAIRVCTTDANDSSNRKLKGAEVWSARIRDDGTLQPMVNSLEFHRTGCKLWKNKVSCGASEVATGIRGYYASTTKGIYGIALRCTKLKPG